MNGMKNAIMQVIYTTQKIKFSIKNFFSKFLHLLKKSLMENFIFCAVILFEWRRG